MAIKEEDKITIDQENTEQETEENKEPMGEQSGEEAPTQKDSPPDDTPEANKQEDQEQDQTDIRSLEAQLEEAKKEKEEYLQSYLRLRADFDNFRRRSREELAQAARQGKEELIQALLPVLDNWERALETAGELDKWRKGVEMIFQQLKTVLAEEGLSPIPTVGETFNPQFHEAVLREPSAQPEDTILEELTKGYLFGEKTLRPSKVKVAAHDPDLASEKEIE
ncbi:MAG: nucleotide exchange factor GrpE [Firmicutes bacterium]|nr:nucleotide exchange factor GrpE [Bacillota bacterium]